MSVDNNPQANRPVTTEQYLSAFDAPVSNQMNAYGHSPEDWKPDSTASVGAQTPSYSEALASLANQQPGSEHILQHSLQQAQNSGESTPA